MTELRVPSCLEANITPLQFPLDFIIAKFPGFRFDLRQHHL